MREPITIKDFLMLPEEEKAERYQDMSDHDRFLWRTQYEPMGGVSVGHFEMTEEEEKAADAALKQILKNIGVIKD